MTLSYGTECKSWLEREDCRRRDFFLPKIVSIERDVVVDGRGDPGGGSEGGGRRR